MQTSSSTIFISGIAGFIGYHLARRLRELGYSVEGCDDFNDYYNPCLKKERAALLLSVGCIIHTLSLKDLKTLYPLFEKKHFSHFIHLAAQAGVRYSLTNPQSYMESNLQGFFEVLELLRRFKNIKLLFASSSSVYGLNEKIPFSETDTTDAPASLYAATKKSNELMAFSYHHLYNIKVIGFRFFTVYGPWGRPDMAYYSFAKSIHLGKEIEVFNEGKMKRDFTYIDDIIDGIVSSLSLETGYEIFNLGNTCPQPLMKLITLLEKYLNKKAKIVMKGMQPGDVVETFADITKARSVLGFSPSISLEEGTKRFVDWLKTHPGF